MYVMCRKCASAREGVGVRMLSLACVHVGVGMCGHVYAYVCVHVRAAMVFNSIVNG